MKIFEILGLKNQQPFEKTYKSVSVEAADSKFPPLGEKPKWSRPGHSIERNLEASTKGK